MQKLITIIIAIALLFLAWLAFLAITRIDGGFSFFNSNNDNNINRNGRNDRAISMEASTYFQEALERRVIQERGQPIEGFEPFMFIEIWNGIHASDFHKSEAMQGFYIYEHDELNFIASDKEPTHRASHALTKSGMHTLFTNIASRLDVEIHTTDDTDDLLQALGEKLIVDETEASHGLLSGKLDVGPFCPVEREDIPCEIPEGAYDAYTIIIKKEKREVTRTRADERGAFQFSLAPGEYTLEVTTTGIQSSNTPKLVEITSRETTSTTISIDTGIR